MFFIIIIIKFYLLEYRVWTVIVLAEQPFR